MSANQGPGVSAGGPAKERGLAAINDARRTRRRAIVFGRVRLREAATKFWLFTFAGLLIFGVIYYRYAQSELATKRNKLAARQRAVVVAAGNTGFALRDKLEEWALGLATAFTASGLIHILLVLAIVVVLIRVIQGRRQVL